MYEKNGKEKKNTKFVPQLLEVIFIEIETRYCR